MMYKFTKLPRAKDFAVKVTYMYQFSLI